MGLSNLTGARQAIHDQQRKDRNFTRGPSWKSEIRRLLPDEAVTIRVVDAPGQPFIWRKHSMSQVGNDYGGSRCMAPEQSCPACVAAEREAGGRKRVKRASDMASFIIYSCRKAALVPQEGRDGRPYDRRVPIRKNNQGQCIHRTGRGAPVQAAAEDQFWVSANNQQGSFAPIGQFPVEDEGFCLWTGSMHSMGNNALNLINLEEKLRRRCMCGSSVGTGADMRPAEIHVSKYTCENCDTEVKFDPLQQLSVVCQACGTAGTPEEDLVCTASCSSPRRGSITECYIQVTRQGDGTNTSYNFVEMPFGPVDPAHLAKPGATLPDPPEVYPQDEQDILAALAKRGLDLDPAASPGAPPQTSWGQGGQGHVSWE